MRQEIMIACAELHEAILNECWSKFGENDVPSVKDKQLINSSCTSIIHHYNSFLETQELDKMVDVEDVENVLSITFSIAQVYMKHCEDNPRLVINNLKKSLEYFQKTEKIVSLKRNIVDPFSEAIKKQIELGKEMQILISQRIIQLS